MISLLLAASLALLSGSPPAATGSITSTVLTSSQITPSGSTLTTASVTPAANRLVLVCVTARLTGTVADNIFSVAGNGLTWERVGEVAHGGSRPVAVFRSMGAAPTAGTIVITEADAASFTGAAAVSVIEFANVLTSGTNGSGAVGTPTETTSGSSQVTSLALTLTGTPGTGDVSFGVYGGHDNTTNLVSDSLWATIQTTGPTDEVLLRADWDTGQDLTSTWTWDNTRDAAAIGFLILQTAPSGGGSGTLVAQDDFDSYSDASDLDAAANWVKVGGTINVVNPGGAGAVVPADNNPTIYRHTATFNANQRSEMTMAAAVTAGNFDWIGPAVRCQSGATSGYGAIVSGGDLYLVSITAGTEATIMSDTAMSLVAGNKIAIEASGTGTSTRLKVQVDTGSGWVDKWTDINPASDIDGGACGIAHWLLTNGSNQVDDWKGYDLP